MEPTPPPLNILPRLTLSPCVQVHPQSDLLTTLSTTPYLPPLPGVLIYILVVCPVILPVCGWCWLT